MQRCVVCRGIQLFIPFGRWQQRKQLQSKSTTICRWHSHNTVHLHAIDFSRGRHFCGAFVSSTFYLRSGYKSEAKWKNKEKGGDNKKMWHCAALCREKGRKSEEWQLTHGRLCADSHDSSFSTAAYEWLIRVVPPTDRCIGRQLNVPKRTVQRKHYKVVMLHKIKTTVGRLMLGEATNSVSLERPSYRVYLSR